MIPSVVALKAIDWYAVAVITAALLPGAVFGLPALGSIVPPRGLLLMDLRGTSLFNGSVVRLLPVALPLILLTSCLPLLLIRRVILPPAVLLLLILLIPGLLLLLPRGIVLLLLLGSPLMVLLLLRHLLLLLL